MVKAFSDRPGWQRGAIIGGWSFVGLMILVAMLPEQPNTAGAIEKPADLAAVRKAYYSLALPCEVAQVRVGAGLGDPASTDPVALAGSVRTMEDACGSAWMTVDDIELPDGLTSAQGDQADVFKTECKTAFWLRKELAEKLVAVVDGDTRPSVIAGLQTDIAEIQRQVETCSAALDALSPAPEETESTE